MSRSIQSMEIPASQAPTAPPKQILHARRFEEEARLREQRTVRKKDADGPQLVSIRV